MKNIEMRPRLISFSIALLMFAAAAAADVPPVQPADVDSARADLIRFADQVTSMPGVDPNAAEQARATIASAQADTVMSLHAALDQMRGWQLPRVAADLSRVEGAECARNELSRFLEELSAAPGMDRNAGEQARQTIATAPDEVVIPLYAALEPIRGWQQLPAVVSELSRQIETQQIARVQRAIDEAIDGPTSDQQHVRSDLLLFVSMLRSFAPLAGPELTQHLNFLEARITTASEPELTKIREIFAEEVKGFRTDLNALRPGGLAVHANLLPATTAAPCDSICADDPFGICDAICAAVVSAFNTVKSGLESAISGLNSTINTLNQQISGYISQVNSLIGQVNGFINQIGQFVTDAFNATANMFNQIAAVVSNLDTTFSNLFSQISSLVTSFWDELIKLVPTTPQAAFDLLTGIQLTSTAWVDTLLSRFPVLDPPCPEIGTSVGPLGTVGTLAAAQRSDGLAKVMKILYDIAPSDVPGLQTKLAIAAVYHPAEYWNLCARSRYAIAQHDFEVVHRDHQTTNLNVALSTRGTQQSFVALGGSVNLADQHVGGADTKLNLLAPKTDELVRRLDTKLSTRALQTSVDALRGTIGNLDLDVAKVESKLDILQKNVRQEGTNESDFQSAAAAYDALMLRLAIEDNLLESSNINVISLFQLPEAFGGNLSLVRSVVDRTMKAMLAAGESIQNAQKELDRGDALMPVGDFAGAFKQFRKAYSEAVKP